jgi:hypothetical protein
MRQVVSAMKISTNLERIADRSVTIARRAKHLNNMPAVREVALLEPAYRLAVVIFRDSMRTFADGDCELARTLKLKDRELDAVTWDVSEKLVARATVDSELVPSYVDLILVARALERIGDHATNIAEDSFWRDQASDIRHTYLRTTERSLTEVSTQGHRARLDLCHADFSGSLSAVYYAPRTVEGAAGLFVLTRKHFPVPHADAALRLESSTPDSGPHCRPNHTSRALWRQ